MSVPFLNQAIARGTFVEFYDPTAQRFPVSRSFAPGPMNLVRAS